jgi:hypothetical protein
VSAATHDGLDALMLLAETKLRLAKEQASAAVATANPVASGAG